MSLADRLFSGMKANKYGFHLIPLARHVCTTAEHRDADRTRETNGRQDHAPRLLTDTCMYIHVTRAPVAPIDQAPGVPVKVGRVAQPSRRRSRHIRPQSVTTQAYQTAESGKWRARCLETLMCHSDTRQYIWIAAGPWPPGPHWPRRLGNVGK